MVADADDGPLDQPPGRLGGDAEFLAHLLVGALAPVDQAEALRDRVLGPVLEDVEQAGDHLLLGLVQDFGLGAGAVVGQQVDGLIAVVVGFVGVVADGAVYEDFEFGMDNYFVASF